MKNFRKFIVEEEPKKTIVRIEEEEFVDPNRTIVRKINMYDDIGELVGAPTLSYSPLDPRSKKESPKPRSGWLERFLEILGWELALESALPPSFESIPVRTGEYSKPRKENLS